jgi:hypothetical protein
VVGAVQPVPPFNFKRSQQNAERMIARWGRRGALRRVGVKDVNVRLALIAYTPMERMGKMIDALDRKALIGGIDLDGETVLEPDPDRDRLITFKVDPVTGLTLLPFVDDESLKIVQRSGRIDPGGLVVFWRLQVRR